MDVASAMTGSVWGSVSHGRQSGRSAWSTYAVLACQCLEEWQQLLHVLI